MQDVWFVASFKTPKIFIFRFSQVMGYAKRNNALPNQHKKGDDESNNIGSGSGSGEYIEVYMNGIAGVFITLEGTDADRFLREYTRWRIDVEDKNVR